MAKCFLSFLFLFFFLFLFPRMDTEASRAADISIRIGWIEAEKKR